MEPEHTLQPVLPGGQEVELSAFCVEALQWDPELWFS